MMIQNLLVANRGEIARRIFRTCDELGVGKVAVFSDATSFETPRRAMFGQLAAQATELWRFALDGEGGKLRLIGEEGGNRLQATGGR